jgi:hypothetical protein
VQAGAWCAYGNPGDLPADQRRDDAQSLCFDSEPLGHPLEILGQPVLELRVAADRPVAHIVARLCDIGPDGASTLITRTALNLCHRDGHADPAPIDPGAELDVQLRLKSIAYAIPAGHRLRIAISTGYWPWLWPSPEPVTIAITTGAASALSVPLRPPRAQDAQLRPFGAPESAAPLEITWLRPRAPEQTITHEAASGRTTLRMARDFSGAQRLPSGLEYDDRDPVTFTIRAGEPLSARVECERRIELRRGEWRTRIEVDASMHADADSYHVTSVVRAYEAERCIHSRRFDATVPRDHT